MLAIMALMRKIAAKDAKNRFGYLLDAAQSAPVRVTKNGRAVGVMMSMQHYERLRGRRLGASDNDDGRLG